MRIRPESAIGAAVGFFACFQSLPRLFSVCLQSPWNPMVPSDRQKVRCGMVLKSGRSLMADWG